MHFSEIMQLQFGKQCHTMLHVFLCLLSSLHTTNFCWPTCVGQLQKVGQLLRSHVKHTSNRNIHQLANMASMVQWHTRTVAASGLLLFYVFRRRNNKKRWRNRKVWVKSYIKSYISTPHLPFFSVCLPHLYIHWTKFPTNPGMTESHQ